METQASVQCSLQILNGQNKHKTRYKATKVTWSCPILLDIPIFSQRFLSMIFCHCKTKSLLIASLLETSKLQNLCQKFNIFIKKRIARKFQNEQFSVGTILL